MAVQCWCLENIKESKEKAMFCNQCGNQIRPEYSTCTYCGAANRSLEYSPDYSSMPQNSGRKMINPSNPPKNPLLMGLLSGCCITGLGQIILGQTLKGVVILLGAVVFGVITGGLGAFIVLPLVGIDAYLIAKKLEAGQSVEEWEFF